MVNKSYKKGYYRERYLVNKARKEGKISFRSAGSHSIIDVVIIDIKKKIIELIQVKNKKLYGKEKKKLEYLEDLSDEYLVKFKVWSKNEN